MTDVKNDIILNSNVHLNQDLDFVTRDIIQKLMHKPRMSFNQLWDKDKLESNKFAYYLKKLVIAGYIVKDDEGYCLSQQGKEYAVFLDGSDGSKKKKPLVCADVVLFDGKGNILSARRTKEPFYGYCGYGSSGKVEFGEHLSEAALKELREETNLVADINLKGIYNMVTYDISDDNKKLSYHHMLYRFKGINPKGDLISKNREGEFNWMSIDDAKKIKLFPDMLKVLDDMMDDKFHVVEIKRYMKDGEFVDMEIISDMAI